jgi:phosphatidylserine synthase
MEWDLGFLGLGILVGLALVFGVIVQLATWRTTHWMWLIGAVGYFLGGLFVSEVMFPGVTEAELQPVIDGLAFDEALLGGLVVGAVVVLGVWYVAKLNRPTGLSTGGRGPAPLPR